MSDGEKDALAQHVGNFKRALRDIKSLIFRGLNGVVAITVTG